MVGVWHMEAHTHVSTNLSKFARGYAERLRGGLVTLLPCLDRHPVVKEVIQGCSLLPRVWGRLGNIALVSDVP